MITTTTWMRPWLSAALVVLSLITAPRAQNRVDGELMLFQDNGAWSWFEDERAIVDPLTRKILVGSCGDSSGIGGSVRSGDIDVAWLDLANGRFGSFELRNRLQGDDHNSPALLLRPDGRYLAMYGMHNGSGTAPRYSRWRVSVAPGDPTSWVPERTYLHPRFMSYSNLAHLRQNGKTYNFVRAINYDPNVMVSTDQGNTWTGGGKLLTEGGAGDRPYLKYSSDGESRIHVLTTERHPRDFDNSIYHGFVEGDRLHGSLGNLVDGNILDSVGRRPTQLTPVFRTGTVVGGVTMRRCWTIDLQADPGGAVRALFQTRANDSSADHRLFFARLAGGRWSVHEVCQLGAGLYSRENDYTGLGALHPDRPDTIYLSTPIHPTTGQAHRHHEIYEAKTTNLGSSWTFRAITSGSTVDNLRPIVPSWDAERTAVLWMRGTYRTYVDYDLAVVGRVEAPELEFSQRTYHDATLANTTRTNGSPAQPTGPAVGRGPADGRWHLRTGFGNGGSVWTANGLGDENAPALKTRLTNLAPGQHDVWIAFWSNSEDWRIRAGLAFGALRNIEMRGAAVVEPAKFGTSLVTTGSTVRLYASWLGRAAVGPAGTLDVYVDDFTVGGSTARTWYDGVVTAPAPCPSTLESVGRSCGGQAELIAGSVPRIGTTVQFTVSRGTPGASAAVLLGGSSMQPLDLGPFGYRGCSLLVSPGVALGAGVLDSSGRSAPIALAIPMDPGLRCQSLGLQAAAITPTLLQLTAAVRANVGQ